MIDQMHKVEAVAPRIGLSKQALYAAIRARKFPHIRIGTRIRIPESAIQNWIEDQLRKTTSTRVEEV